MSNHVPPRAASDSGTADLAGFLAALAASIQTQAQAQYQACQPPPTTIAGLQMPAGMSRAQIPAGPPESAQWQIPQVWQQPPQPLKPLDPTSAFSQFISQIMSYVQEPAPPPQPSSTVHGIVSSIVSALQRWNQQQEQQREPQRHQSQQQYVQPPTPQALQQVLPQNTVGYVLDDERRLVDALKSCKALGITPRQALEKLHGVNNHSGRAWKDHFLDNLERLYSLAWPRPENLGRISSSSGASSSQGERPTHTDKRAGVTQQKQPLSSTSSAKGRDRQVLPLPGPSDAPRRSDDAVTWSAIAGVKVNQGDNSPERAEESSRVGTRRTMGASVAEYHAGTLIPPPLGSLKPRPCIPTLGEDNGGRLTPDDHIFFIHYLRWRLSRKPNVTKQELYEELAEQTPQHDADAWKRHWDHNAELPDRIYIGARRNADPSEESDLSGPDSEREDHAKGQDRVGESPPLTGSDGAYLVVKPGRAYARGPHEITDEDLQAMARYRLDNAAIWPTLETRKSRWEGFALRPENAAKRTIAGWSIIERSHGQMIEAYYKMYETGELATASRESRPIRPLPRNLPGRLSGKEAKPAPVETAESQANAPPPAASIRSRLENEDAASKGKSAFAIHDVPENRRVMGIPPKRGFSEVAAASGSLTNKKPKEAPREIIVLDV